MLKFCDRVLKASKLETAFGIEIINNLNFEDHIKVVCSKTTKKLNTLQSIANFIDYSEINFLFQ